MGIEPQGAAVHGGGACVSALARQGQYACALFDQRSAGADHLTRKCRARVVAAEGQDIARHLDPTGARQGAECLG